MTNIVRRTVRLADLAAIKVGFPFPSAKFVCDEHRPRLLRGINVKRGNLDWSGESAKRWGGGDDGMDDYLLQENDLVVAMDGALVGRSYATVTKEDLPAYLVQRVARVRAVDPRSQSYLRHLIGSKQFVAHVDRVKTHTAVPHISGRDIQEFACIDLPVEIQEQVGQLFDYFVQTTNLLQQSITTKQRFKRGLMQQLLTGRKRFPEFKDCPWEIHRFDALCEELSDRNGKQLDAESVMGVIKGIGFERMRDRVRGKGDLARYKIVPPGAFAFNPMRLNIGSIAYNDLGRPILVSPDYEVFRARADVAVPEFVNQLRYSSYWTNFMKRAGAGSVRVRIYFSDLARLRVPGPAVVEQKRIAGVLRLVDTEVVQLKELQKLTESQKSALLSQLLSGELFGSMS